MTTSSALPQPAEHPLLLTTDLVRAVLKGAKTQTRRPAADLKNSTLGGRGQRAAFARLRWDLPVHVDHGPSPAGNTGPYLHVHAGDTDDETITTRVYPRVQVGDLLWVRETWGDADRYYQCHENDEPGVVAYRADMSAIQWNAAKPRPIPGYDIGQWNWSAMSWRPSIHMPKHFARLWLRVTEVRAEQPIAITDIDARAEGTAPADESHKRWPSYGPAVDGFLNTYEAIYGAAALTGWSWGYVFERVEKHVRA